MENIIKESEMHGTKMKETETENWDRNNKKSDNNNDKKTKNPNSARNEDSILIDVSSDDEEIKVIQNEMTNTINILKNNKNSTLNDEESNIRKQYSCTECKYECFDMTTYLFHIQIHKNTKIISCSICGIKFTNKRNLNKHNKRYHVKVKRNSNFKCSSKRICFPHKKIHRSEEILTLFDNKARIKSLNES